MFVHRYLFVHRHLYIATCTSRLVHRDLYIATCTSLLVHSGVPVLFRTLSSTNRGSGAWIHRHWRPPHPNLPALTRGTPAEAHGGAADNWTRRCWRDARDRSSNWRGYKSVRAFLLAAGKCDHAGGGDHIEEWACKKTQHRRTISKIPPTATKQMSMQIINDSIKQLTSTPRVCSGAEWNGGGKTRSGWRTAGLNGTDWPFPNDADAAVPPPPPSSLRACSMSNRTQGRPALTPPP